VFIVETRPNAFFKYGKRASGHDLQQNNHFAVAKRRGSALGKNAGAVSGEPIDAIRFNSTIPTNVRGCKRNGKIIMKDLVPMSRA